MDLIALQRHVQCIVNSQQSDITLAYKDFSNPLIARCAREINEKHTFEPLNNLWLQSYMTTDKEFISEFAWLTFFSYQALLVRCANCTQQRNVWIAIATLYSKLGRLPLPTLFEVLDECLDHYFVLMEEYDGDIAKTVKAWLRHNWWVPLTIVTFCTVSFMRWRMEGQMKKGENEPFLIDEFISKQMSAQLRMK